MCRLDREVRRTDAFGHVTETGYDALGRMVSVGGDAYSLKTGYDTQGRKTSGKTTRDNGAIWDETQWAFDPASGMNTGKTYADGSQVSYAYTDNGKMTRTTWARGAWKSNAYNARNLVSGTTYSGAGTPSIVYTYEDSGKVASTTLSDGTSYDYGYDDRLLNTNEIVTVGGEDFALNRTFDDFRRALETAVVVTDVRHAAKTRLYDSENRVCGYALTNAAGRGVSVSLAYDGSYLTNIVYTLPNGCVFSAKLTRKAGRKELVTRRDYFFGGQSIYWYSTEYDLLNRPTNAVDSVSLVREWLYNRRSELAAANIGTNCYGYAYDTIGNRLGSTANTATNTYAANSLNQYTSIQEISAPSAGEIIPAYDADGNMTQCGDWTCAYDAENRLIAVYPISPVAGSLAVVSRYDHRHRRVQKIVKRYDGMTWETAETHTFVWDGNNIVLEKVEFANGTTRTLEYFWGMDKSGTEQGAGGVEGLLAVSVDGVFYIPCYDHNGNIVLYVSETGSIAAQYTYDPYGNVIGQSGGRAATFVFGFSTKYHDREMGMVSYQRRFYRPDLGRWLNRDPIEERGGGNLYAFCFNSSPALFDPFGLKCTVGTFNVRSITITSTPQWIKTDLNALERDAKALMNALNKAGHVSAATSLAASYGLSALLLNVADIATIGNTSPSVGNLSRSILEFLRKLRAQGPLRLDGVLKWERCECVGRKTKWVKQADITDSDDVDIENIGIDVSLAEDFRRKYNEVMRALIKSMYEQLKK